MNVDRLRKLADVLEKTKYAYVGDFDALEFHNHPNPNTDNLGFSMVTFIGEVYNIHTKECHSVACVAGHACHLFADDAYYPEDIDEQAAKYLGLDFSVARVLFSPSGRDLPQVDGKIVAWEQITNEMAAQACRNLADGVRANDIWQHKIGDNE